MSPWVLVGIFIAASGLGYLVIRRVPALLHTPLMSGMNALSGVTVLGALGATGLAVMTESRALGFLALLLAVVNLAGGLTVTQRMLRLFRRRRRHK